MSTVSEWASKRFGIVWFRQAGDRLRHRLSFVPGLYVIGAILLVQILLVVDRSLADAAVPDFLTTTVASARSVFTVIAGGLITAITLLLSMMLITVQLAGTQFSPRTLRNWLGSRQIQHTIGLALGTTVFCLLGLRTTRTVGDGGAVVPHLTVITAVVLGVAALFAVVGSVDHLTNSMRIGAVAQRLADETIAVVRAKDEVRAGEEPSVAPARVPPSLADDELQIPADAVPVTTGSAGWVQQIDISTVLAALEPGSTARVVVPLGGFAPAESPLAWVSPPPDDETCSALLEGFAVGDTRTMQQDVGFGLIQLTDIAVRALSPGVNDPGTANDVVVQLGNVLTALWERPTSMAKVSEDDRTVISPSVEHADHLHRALDPIRRYGRSDPLVTATLMRTLRSLRSEVLRRRLPGPVEPIENLVRETHGSADTAGWSATEIDLVDRLAADLAMPDSAVRAGSPARSRSADG